MRSGAAIVGKQQRLGPRVQAAALVAPPAANRGHREGSRLVIRADVDDALISDSQISCPGSEIGYPRCE
jgi:hypothetical protein